MCFMKNIMAFSSKMLWFGILRKWFGHEHFSVLMVNLMWVYNLMDCWEVGASWRKWVVLSTSLELYLMYGSLHGPSQPLSHNQLLLTVPVCLIKTRDYGLKCLWSWVHIHHWFFSGTFKMVTRNWIIHLMRCWLDWFIIEDKWAIIL